MVHEERMTPGHCLVSVLWVSFSALTLLVGWQEGYPAMKKTSATSCQRFCSRRRKPWGNRLLQSHREKQPLKWMQIVIINERNCFWSTVSPAFQLPLGKWLITFRVRRSRGKMYIGHGRLCVCLSVPCRIPTLLHRPGCKLGNGWGVSSSCAVLGRFAIGAWVSSLWQHSTKGKISANACIFSMPGLLRIQSPSPPVDSIWAMVIVRRIRRNIIGTVPCCNVYNSCTQRCAQTWAVLKVDYWFRLCLDLSFVFLCFTGRYGAVFFSSTTTKTKIFVEENKLICVTKTMTTTKIRQLSSTKQNLKLKFNLLTKMTTKIWLFPSTRRKFQSRILA